MNGIIAVLISSCFLVAKDILSKKIVMRMHSNVSACTSFLFAIPYYVFLLLIMHIAGVQPFAYTGDFLLFVFLRSLTDSVMELCKMHALSHGEISFISNFFSLTPVFLLFIAPLITGDTIPLSGIVGVGIILLGTCILLKAPKESIPWKGVFFAIMAAFFGALNACFDRLAVSQANPVFSGFVMTLFSGAMLFPLMFKVKSYKRDIKANYTVLHQRGVCEVAFMAIKLYGYKFLEPQYVSGIQKIALFFSVGIGGKVFNDHDRIKRLIASLVIVIGSVVLVLTKLS